MTQSSRAVPEAGVDSGVASASVRPEPTAVEAMTSWNTNSEACRAIFNAALTGICANPNFFSSLFQQSPEAAVEFANQCVLAAIRSNGGAQ